MALNRSIYEFVMAAIEAEQHDVFTTLPGEVQSYAGGFADVRPCVKRPIRTESGEAREEEFPIVPSCRVLFLQAGPFAFTFPIVKGDTGLLLVSMYALAQWLENGEIAGPKDARPHSLGSAVFLPGLSVNANKPAEVDATDVVIEAPMMRLGAGATSFAALATLVENELNGIAASIAAGFDATTGPPLHSSPTTPYIPGPVAATKVKVE